jgi:hypothetical protein
LVMSKSLRRVLAMPEPAGGATGRSFAADAMESAV